jgi:glutathione S-transferase
VIPGGFTGIPERTGGQTERLPAIVDDGRWVLDSWLIAEYLDEKYPDRPTLIGDPSVKICAQFIEGWLWSTAIGPWMRCYVVSYRDRSLECDHEYVTTSREKMMGCKLEDLIVGREDRLSGISAALEPLRGTLREHQWFGGESPNYVDYRLLAGFLWLASVADTPPLAEDDPLRDWIERGMDLYGGLGRHPGLSPLFGLKPGAGHPEPFDRTPREFGLNKRNTGPTSTAKETAMLKGEKADA